MQVAKLLSNLSKKSGRSLYTVKLGIPMMLCNMLIYYGFGHNMKVSYLL